jgi:hypothetical protein
MGLPAAQRPDSEETNQIAQACEGEELNAMNNKKIHPSNQSPKINESVRIITVSLPEKTLSVLEACDQDLAEAIVKVTDRAAQRAFPKGNSYEVVNVAPHKSVFIVGSKTHLANIRWIKLVEVAPGRNLITIPPGTSLESLEVAVLELIENLPSEDVLDQALLKEFCKYVGRLRRNKKISTVEILLVDTDE